MKLRKIRLIFLFSCACAIPFLILVLPMIGFKEEVTKIDWYSPFYIFTLLFAVGALLFIKLFKDFTSWLKSLIPNPQSLIYLFITTLIAIFICFFWIEGNSRVQMDESIYLSVAQNLYHNQIGTICSEGSFENGKLECSSSNTVKPRGLSYLYMLGMPFFGTDLYWIYNFQVFILALTIPILFLALLAWLKNKELALLTATLLGMQPMLLFYSRSSSIEGFYVLMFALSLLFLKWACDSNTTRHWLLLASILAFFAQTRSETIFCLFAFIFIAAIRMSNGQWKKTLNSQFSIFLITLAFFCIPILCTLSINRDSDLQGGIYSAHGHLFSNILANFKIMAIPNYGPHNWPVPKLFLPYFTWLALFGLITLIILIIKEFRSKNSLSIINYPLSIRYSHIAFFLLLLSPQYIILFDSVSADLHLGVQSRFVLIILPAMSFLGALFIWQAIALLKTRVNPKILLIGVQTIILTTTLMQFENFKHNMPFRHDKLTKEYHLLNKFILENHSPKEKKIFFAFTPLIFFAHGNSAFSFNIMLTASKEHIEDLIKQYNGNVYISENFCYNGGGAPKMTFPIAFRYCDRAVSYFDTDTLLNIKLSKNENEVLILHRVLRLNERDPKGLLRITNKIEPTDSTVDLVFIVPKDTAVPWRIKHFVNDSFLHYSPYKQGNYANLLKLSLFNRDTNFWRLDIIDTITNEKIHSDFWQLIRTESRKSEK
jgi:hypothetical protein